MDLLFCFESISFHGHSSDGQWRRKNVQKNCGPNLWRPIWLDSLKTPKSGPGLSTANTDRLPVMFSGRQTCCLRRSIVGATGKMSGRTWLVDASTVSSSAKGGSGWLLYTIECCVPRIEMCLCPGAKPHHQTFCIALLGLRTQVENSLSFFV